MRWMRGGRPLQQVQTQIDPPDEEEDDRYRRYQGYPVVVVVRGKRVVAWLYD